MTARLLVRRRAGVSFGMVCVDNVSEEADEVAAVDEDGGIDDDDSDDDDNDDDDVVVVCDTDCIDEAAS